MFLFLILGALLQTPDEETPRPSRIVEQAESSLAQLDITLLGPPERIAEVTRDDLVIRLQGEKIPEFTLDRHCDPGSLVERSRPRRRKADSVGDSTAATATPPRGSYLLFFDQQQLTQSGRHQALRLARDLVVDLAGPESRVMLVSNAAELKVIQPFTNDTTTLLDGLDRLAADRRQWDWVAEGEEIRVGEVIRALNDADDLHRAIGLARDHQKEELWRANRSFRRLGISLAPLKDGPSPRAVLYFADTLRSNPGHHYLSFLGSSVQREHSALGLVGTGAETGGLAYNDVVNTAAANGIRVYMIQSEGLVSGSDRTRITSRAAAVTLSVGNSSMVRVRDTQKTMRNMAAETGGEAFLNGVQSHTILSRIDEDASCLFVVSIPTKDLPLDRPMRVDVDFRKAGVTSRVRGRLVLQSAKSRQRSRLLQAFSAPGTLSDPLDIEAGVIPLGYEEGGFRGLLQIRIPAVAFPGSRWDVGASVVNRQRVREEMSRQVTLTRPGLPLVVEHEITFRPGDSKVVAVVQEATTGLVASREFVVNWPNLRSGAPGLGPVAVLQPLQAAFIRGEETRGEGSLSGDGTRPL